MNKIFASRGTGEQFIAALEDRINELEGGVGAATNTSNIGTPIKGAEADDSYLEQLIDRVKSELYLTDDSAHVEVDNNNIYITVYSGGEAIDEFTIPFADLSFDDNSMDTDINYIVENIGPELGVF